MSINTQKIEFLNPSNIAFNVAVITPNQPRQGLQPVLPSKLYKSGSINLLNSNNTNGLNLVGSTISGIDNINSLGTLSINGNTVNNGTLAVTSNITSEGTLGRFGSKKFQSFVGSLANINTTIDYTDNDCLVELGTLDIFTPAGIATNHFIDKIVIGIKTGSGTADHIGCTGVAFTANLALSNTSGIVSNNVFVDNFTEIAGDGMQCTSDFDLTATPVDGIDIDLELNNGSYVIAPNLQVPINQKYLYLRTSTELTSGITGTAMCAKNVRFTVNITYTSY